MGRHGKMYTGGVTLIELLVVVALMALVQAFGAPAMSGLVDSFRLTTGSNAFFSSLMLARSEAAKHRTRVVLCKSSDGQRCSQVGGWEQGWIVFRDVNNNAARDEGEALLWRETALAGRVRITGNLHVTHYLSYTPEGPTRHTSGAFQVGTFTVCIPSSGPVEARQIAVAITGRPRTARVTVDRCS